MTIYNAALFLARSLDSVLAQTFSDWELIAIENGSTDESAHILGQYRDSRVRIVRLEKNIGRTPALRLALELACGEYVAVLDADDVAQPERLRKQTEYLDRHSEAAFLGTWAEYIDEDDRCIGRWSPPTEAQALFEGLASENPIVHSSSMYRRALAKQVGGYPRDAVHSQDLALWLELVKFGQPALLAEYLCQFRVVSTSMSRTWRYRLELASDQLQLLVKAGKELPLGNTARRRNREAVAIARMRYAAALLGRRRYSAAAKVVALALLMDPMPLFCNRVTRGFLRQ